jgi:hypothetical protein
MIVVNETRSIGTYPSPALQAIFRRWDAEIEATREPLDSPLATHGCGSRSTADFDEMRYALDRRRPAYDLSQPNFGLTDAEVCYEAARDAAERGDGATTRKWLEQARMREEPPRDPPHLVCVEHAYGTTYRLQTPIMCY